ncbi:hypothetical protein NCG89_03980 [Spongiibacter taiwanensis]|uniref:hypothetical protein n=1 Tax=Spongiibacter taiwanensis TaxID=1748242 RepID=UPI0020363227|nr:hypothetical protein [Spongiibacter taiwanensis]USA43951.1 hypothetical protein NCG89_03980 [Spongiibacter taiwanensis]
MADAIDQWLDELAGRRQDDPMIAALRQALLAGQHDAAGQLNDLAFQRLLRRLEGEGLLNTSPQVRRQSQNEPSGDSADSVTARSVAEQQRVTRPPIPSRWPRLVGIAATVVAAILLVRPQWPVERSLQFASAPAERASELLVSEEADGELVVAPAAPSAAMSKSSPDRGLTMDRQERRAFSSAGAASDSAAERADAVASVPPMSALQQGKGPAAPPACQRKRGERLQVELANLNLAQTRRFYAALAQIEALEFTYSRPAGPSDIMLHSAAARAALASLLAEFGWQGCDLRGVTRLSVAVLPGASSP